MADPSTLTAVAAPLLTEGIKFLYAQAGEVLKRWRQHKDEAAKHASVPLMPPQPAQIILPDAFEGQVTNQELRFEIVERLEVPLRDLRKDLAEYAEGIEPIDSGNPHLLQLIDALRQILEAVYQQRFTLKGEQRPPSGPLVLGRVEVEDVFGYAAAVRARTIRSGQITGEAKAGHVGPDGRIVGVDIDTVGG